MTFMTVGMYQKPLPVQNGAPIRLTVPWKYGFKSIKSIRSIELTAERPQTYWVRSSPLEYGFWANVNPDVPHRRWSQAREREIYLASYGGPMIATQLYNGYGHFVEHLYAGPEMAGESLFF